MSGRQPHHDDRMEEDNRPPPEYPNNWVYAHELGLVIHMPGSCKQCDEFLSHSMQASVQRLRSYHEAVSQRADSMNAQLRRANHRIEEQMDEENELRRQLRIARREADDLRDELTRERSRGSSTQAVAMPPRTGPYDERRHNNDTRRKVQQAREERSTRSYSSVVQSPAPPSSNVPVAPPPPPASSAGSSTQRESVASSSNAPPPEGNRPFFVYQAQLPVEASEGGDGDDDDDLPRGERPEAVEGVAASEFGRRWKAWVQAGPYGSGEDVTRDQQLVPKMVEQFLFLDRLMHQSRSDALAQYLGTFRATAQSVKRENRTNAQVKACERWKKPDWASSSIFNHQTMQMERTTMAGVRMETGEKQKTSAARLQREVESVAIGQGLMINNAPHPHLGSPTRPQHKDHPAIWQSYFLEHYGHQRALPRGLVRENAQCTVPENLLRAFHRLGRLTSQMSNVIQKDGIGTIAVFRMRMFRMLAIAGEYRRTVKAHSSTIAPIPALQLDEYPPYVVTEKVVAEYLARMGYTFAEADAAWQYARNWILQLDEDELRKEPLDIYREAMYHVGDPDAPVPKHLHSLDAAPYVWDNTLERWRIEPNALNAVNSALESAPEAKGPSTSMASKGAAAPKTTMTTAPAELASSSTSATADAPPAVMEQVLDATMTGTGEPGEITVAPQDQDMEAPKENQPHAMDQT
jgi:hypothetical protein